MNTPIRARFIRQALVFALAAAGVAVLAAFTNTKPASSTGTASQPDRTTGPAPLFNRLGGFTKRVSTTSPLAQRYFDQGMMFVYGFNHREAIRSFKAAVEVDPKLAIAWWGAAFAYGPHINAPMEGSDLPPAIDAIRKARALATNAGSWERAFIEALATRYSEDPAAERPPLDTAYAAAMGEVARQFPDDPDAAVLHADAVMNTMAWDYWLPDKKTPKPATREVIAALDRVLARHPDHPGANHLMIHLVEAGPNPAKGLASADALKFYALDAGHLVHMPSHIYMRTGRYEEAALASVRAAEGDRAYIEQCNAQGFYPGAYYPHNEHFLWWACTFQGKRAAALEKAAEIVKLASSPMCGSPVVEKPRFTHLVLLTAIRFADWETILAAAEPPAEEALDRVIWHWARATAMAAKGQAESAAKEAAHARTLADGEGVKAMDNPYLPAIRIADIAAHLAAGRAAWARGAKDSALESFRAAVAVEDAMPYMEPAFWFYPTRHTLGAALLGIGKPAEAEAVFRADLGFWPENGWSLHGLTLALEQQKKKRDAEATRSRFAAAWQHADTQPRMEMF